MLSRLDLSENWAFSGGNGVKEFFNGTTSLPSCNFADLLSNGLIKDPFTGCNEAELQYIGDLDWIYKNTFNADGAVLNAHTARLHFDSVDTIAEIFLNGELLAKTDNAHTAYEFDVKGKLCAGDNTLEVKIQSPVKYVEKMRKKYAAPPHRNGITGFCLIRKPAYHFGWDWGPVLPCSGLNGAAYIIYTDREILKSTRTAQAFDGGKAELSVYADVELVNGLTKVNMRLYSPSGSLISEKTAEKNEGSLFKTAFNIDSPELWYANGMTDRKKQPLYTVTVDVFHAAELVDSKTFKAGLREIKLSLEKVEGGRDFCFLVNGQRIFSKGANWIPADSFTSRVTSEKLEYYIRNAAECNFNMIRIWGGGYYASDAFMDLCDEYGILVWHDFAFACSPYPFYIKEFTDSVLKEAEYNIMRLRDHASLALLCGNNEMEQIPYGPSLRKTLESSRKFFYEILPKVIRGLCDTAYWQSSPASGEFKKNTASDYVGDQHIWAVWHGMMPFDYFFTRFPRFCSEFGFESFPSMNTVRKFSANEKDYNLRSAVMRAHQKCASGNGKILYYVIKNYSIPKKFEHFVYLSQLTQAENISAAVEHWRRNQPRCNGSLYWQYNDCWPVSSWASVDYFGNFKALQYYAKRFYAPVALSVTADKEKIAVHCVNDSINAFSGVLSFRLIDFDGNVYSSDEKEITIGAYSAAEAVRLYSFKRLKKADYKNAAVIAELKDKNGKLLFTKTSLLTSEKEAALKKPNITKTVTETEDGYEITLSADTYVRCAMLELKDSNAAFSDNFFDMEKGKAYTVKLQKGEYDLETLTLTSVADMERKYPKWRERLKQLAISATPLNVINRIIYKFV